MKKINDTITFHCGKQMKNRFMLAPMTNQQSNEDGTLSEDEFHWLTKRAEGGFGLVMTCASHVQKNGKGFDGQLGIFDTFHEGGHQRLATKIKEYNSLAVVQLHHAGMRSPQNLIEGRPICPSDNEKYGARAMEFHEIEELREAFVDAAIRAKKCGYDGVEIHAAHGYILGQFLSKEINYRTDEYGGDLEGRSRLLIEIVSAIREKCGKDFLLGVRLSPERFGMDIFETKELCGVLANSDNIDFLDISLWDCFKMPHDVKYQDKSLLAHFTDLNYQNVLLTVAGNIKGGADVSKILESSVDFVAIGKAGILHHDFPKKVLQDLTFESESTPVEQSYLKKEGLGPKFIEYLTKWPGFIG